jgi:hypothetical protein
MEVFFTVKSCYSKTPVQDQLSGNIRHYYLAAELEEWDYAPSGMNLYDGKNLTEPGRLACTIVTYKTFIDHFLYSFHREHVN